MKKLILLITVEINAPSWGGCTWDSRINFASLAVTTPLHSVDSYAACSPFIWPLNGQTYTASNNTDTVAYLTSITGCDSIVTLDLTI